MKHDLLVKSAKLPQNIKFNNQPQMYERFITIIICGNVEPMENVTYLMKTCFAEYKSRRQYLEALYICLN